MVIAESGGGIQFEEVCAFVQSVTGSCAPWAHCVGFYCITIQSSMGSIRREYFLVTQHQRLAY